MRPESTRRRLNPFTQLVLAMGLVVSLVACGSDSNEAPTTDSAGDTAATAAPTEPADPADTEPAETDADEPAEATETETETGGSGEDPAPAVSFEGGSATLTIGNETFDFDTFFCGFGHEATEDDEIGFAAGGKGTDSDGTPVQIGVQLFDAGIREGFTQVQVLRMDSSGEFDFIWTLSDTEPLAVEDPTGRAAVSLEGDVLTIEGGAYDRMEGRVETGEQAQGMLEAVCSPDSLR